MKQSISIKTQPLPGSISGFPGFLLISGNRNYLLASQNSKEILKKYTNPAFPKECGIFYTYL